ncbi:MAG: methylated-DNA--[protein]-cysteine S-methyltransferase [Candidatus Pristimantibacillus sp.]
MSITNASIVYWTKFQLHQWNMYLAATENGLCYVSSMDGPFEELAEWQKARLPAHQLLQDDKAMKRYTVEFESYLLGLIEGFTFPLDLIGTPFQLKVWSALSNIQYGHTASYSEIAIAIGRPQAARAVGAAIGANPLLIALPCHRIVSKEETLTGTGGYRGGLTMKSSLLELEQTRS